MVGRVWIAGLALGALLLGTGAARAGASDRRRVAAHKRAAFERLQEGDYAGGIDEMRAAYALLPHPGFLLNIAVAYHQWGGHCREASEAFARFYEACPDCDLRPAGEEKRRAMVRDCEVPVTVRTVPPGAALVLDGETVGVAPSELRVLRGGRHRVEARLEGFAPAQQGFEVGEGAGPSLVLRLVPLAAPPPVAPRTPAGAVRVPRGEGAGPGAWPWVALGAGAAGLGAGAAFTVQTLELVDREAEARANGESRASIVGLRDEAETNAILAHVGYGAGVLGVGAAILLWALDGGEAEPELAVFGAGAGAGARLRF